MDKILISIKPKFINEILKYNKTIELRRRAGRGFAPDNQIYLYSSTPVKALVGKAFIREVEKLELKNIGSKKVEVLKKACISSNEFDSYFSDSTVCYLIHIDRVEAFLNMIPLKTLRELQVLPPQSFCYLPVEIAKILDKKGSES